MNSLLDDVSKCICDSVRQKLELQNEELPLVKRNKTLKKGDFQMPLSGLLKAMGSKNNLSQLEDSLKDGVHGEYISKSLIVDKKLFVFLHRLRVFQKEITRVLKTEHPWTQEKKAETVLINVSLLGNTEKTLSHLRTVLLSKHISKLLEADGYTVECRIPDETELIDFSKNETVPTDINSSCSELYDGLESNKFSEKCENDTLVINYGALICELRLQQGKDGYDKNIDKGILKKEDEKLRIVASMEKFHLSCLKKPSRCIHIMAANTSFAMQQVDLLWQMSGDVPKQVHIAHGPVATKMSAAGSTLTAQEFLGMREEETRQAFQMKYGDHVCGDKWASIIKELASAAVKFEFLSTSCQNSLKLNICQTEGGEVENRAGVFVMYNYARLATLIQHYNEAVSKGTYPPMPDVADINFTLLKEEGEWELMFNYILPYPNLLQDCIADLANDNVKLNIHTHKTCRFMADLSRDLSSYYSRVHVLGEGLGHLLPLMYARLTLLRAVKKVMEHGLYLLNIAPISQL